jgi:hypothetical protein
MKTPHLTTAILAAAALGSQSHAVSSKMDFTIRAPDPFPVFDVSPAWNERRFTCPSQINWSQRNQRQKRKDRRRAFANGNRKAFQ